MTFRFSFSKVGEGTPVADKIGRRQVIVNKIVRFGTLFVSLVENMVFNRFLVQINLIQFVEYLIVI